MDGQGKSKRLALDLAAGLEFAHTFREDFQSLGYSLLLAPTAAEEIWLIHNNPQHPRRHLATKALENLTDRGIGLLELKSHVQPVARSIGRSFARRLILGGHLPPEEVNDGIILAEAALAEIPVHVTSDQHLLALRKWTWLFACKRRTSRR